MDARCHFVPRAPISLARRSFTASAMWHTKCWLEVESEREAEPCDEIPNILGEGFLRVKKEEIHTALLSHLA